MTAAVVSAAAFIAIVTPSNPADWAQHSTGSSSVQFVNGPDTPPSGLGSLEFHVDQKGKSGAQLRLSDDTWSMPLSELGSLSYSTFVQTDKHCKGGEKQVVYVALDIDLTGDGEPDDTIIFAPPDDDVLCRTWQHWDAKNGLWSSTDDHKFKKTRPLADYIAAHPGAKIVHGADGGGVRLVAGFGSGEWKGFIGNADAFDISRNIPCPPEGPCLGGPAGFYDFEAEGVCPTP